MDLLSSISSPHIHEIRWDLAEIETNDSFHWKDLASILGSSKFDRLLQLKISHTLEYEDHESLSQLRSSWQIFQKQVVEALPSHIDIVFSDDEEMVEEEECSCGMGLFD